MKDRAKDTRIQTLWTSTKSKLTLLKHQRRQTSASIVEKRDTGPKTAIARRTNKELVEGLAPTEYRFTKELPKGEGSKEEAKDAETPKEEGVRSKKGKEEP